MRKTKQEHKPRGPQVILTVSAGVVDVVMKPRGVTVAVYDYDIGGADEGDAAISKDPAGRPCSVRRWEPSEEIVANEHWPMAKDTLQDQHRHLWKCPDCGWKTHLSYERLAEAGSPICPDCDIEMQMV